MENQKKNCSPWDPRCSYKSEIFIAITPDKSSKIFQTMDEALKFLKDESGNYYGVIHRQPTQVAYLYAGSPESK